MDPTACLRELRQAIAVGEFKNAAELFLGLDEWLSGGGFLPAQWSR